jgi:hypothetical protein
MAALKARMGLSIGDPVDSSTLGRGREVLRRFDEHLRMTVHSERNGDLEIVIVAP